jgi:hypothetical protein
VTAEEARQLADALGLGENVKRVVADAPPPSDQQLVALRSILRTALDASGGADANTDAAATRSTTTDPTKSGRFVVPDDTAATGRAREPDALPPWSHECETCRRADTEGWTGLNDAAHCHSCHYTWTSKRAAHCPACCEHFTSYSASDLHDGPDGCIPPATVPGLVLAADGRTWRLADQSRLPISAASPGDSAPETGAVECAVVVVPEAVAS